MRQGAAQYQRTSETRISGRDTECAAFNMVNRELIACGSGPARIKALGRNHMLWSLLVKDLALSDNQMPDPLKSELIALGLWSMRYSTLAILKDLPVEPLIEVNTNMADGLAQQQANAAAAQPPAPAASFAI